MELVPAQYAAMKAHIAANTAQVRLEGTVGTTPINEVGVNPGNCQAIADWYNLDVSPTYKVWNNAALLKEMRAALDVAKFTPADSVPASGNTTQITNDQLRFQNQAMVCQLKQDNAKWVTDGEGTVNTTSQVFRQSFNDCMTGIPSGANGANQNAGWGTAGSPGAVRLAMQRTATNVEKIYSVQAAGAGAAGNVPADARGGNTNPDALVFVGPVSGNDVLLAMSS